jgi:hypothetical protein
MSYLRYCLFVWGIVISNKYCVVFLFCLSSSYVPNVAIFSDLSFLIAPSVFSNVYLVYILLFFILISFLFFVVMIN